MPPLPAGGTLTPSMPLHPVPAREGLLLLFVMI